MSSELSRNRWPGFQIQEDIHFQRRQWIVQRCGWLLMALLVLSGLLGVFGDGPLSRSTKEESGLSADYQRFLRTHKPSRLTIKVDTRHAKDGSVTLWLGQNFIDRVQLEQITPAPRSSQASGDGVILTFLTGERTGAARVDIFFQARDVGRFEASLGLVDGPRVTISGFSYP